MMRISLAVFAMLAALTLGTIGPSAIETIYPASRAIQAADSTGEKDTSKTEASNGVRYKLDASQSRFMVDAKAAGLLWFLGHNHHIAAREFYGEAVLAEGTLEPASLQMTVKTESLVETGERFTDQQKKIITDSMHKEVLETSKYPDAVLKSTKVVSKKTGENRYEIKIEGELTLHGVTRRIVIPAQVTVEGEILRSSGKLEFDRDDFNIKTHSIKWGTIKVDDDMKLSFNIVARRF